MVNRTRLFEKCDSSETCRLLLVNAPAGFGKTVLISSWISNRNKNAAWLSLDETMNSPFVFFAYLTQAMQNAIPFLCQTVKGLIYSDDPPPHQTIMRCLVSELLELDRELVLVLDDYHIIENQAIDNLLELFIKNIPSHLKVILITRSAPRFPVSSLRLQADIAEITALDLRFNLAEIKQYFKIKPLINISTETLKKIEACTEGWVTGLQLAFIYFSTYSEDLNQISTICGENRFVSDYFFDEILSRLIPKVRDFLIASSIFSQFSPSLCNYVLQIEDAHATIREIEDLN
ncbi:NACHT domain-containing protein [bacterium]|nr:NACHT domain-containing protein [bacterium]